MFSLGVTTIVTCCTLPVGAGATIAAELNGYLESYGYLDYTVGLLDPMKARLPMLIICVLYCGFIATRFAPVSYTHLDNRAFREGKFQRPSDPRSLYDGSEGFGISCPSNLGPLGSMYNFNYLIETKNNYRIDFSAGRDFEEHLQHVQKERPNLMLRHRIRSYTPEQYADMICLLYTSRCV